MKLDISGKEIFLNGYTLHVGGIIFELIDIRPRQAPCAEQSLVTVDIFPQMLRLNLELIDSKLPEILIHAILYNINRFPVSWAEIILLLTKDNPVGYNLSLGHEIYKNKIASFLIAVALGMASTSVWKGVPADQHGMIIFGDSLPLKLEYKYNRMAFQEFLFINTQLQINLVDCEVSTSLDIKIVVRPANNTSLISDCPPQSAWLN